MKDFARKLCVCAAAAGLASGAWAQSEFALKSQTLSNPDNEPAEVHPVPHERQMKWNETEFYAFSTTA